MPSSNQRSAGQYIISAHLSALPWRQRNKGNIPLNPGCVKELPDYKTRIQVTMMSALKDTLGSLPQGTASPKKLYTLDSKIDCEV